MSADNAVNLDALLAAGVTDAQARYSDIDAITYALGIGFGGDGAEAKELEYIYEGRGLRTVPSMAGIILHNRFLTESGWDLDKVSVVEQKLELYRPLPAAADLRADRRVVAVLDHGRDKGVSVMVESEVRMAKDGTVLFTLASTFLAGGQGGVGLPAGNGPLPHRLPTREADLVSSVRSNARMPYIFRLSYDRSALYADLHAARTAGHKATPLHAQCIAGMACRSILSTICDYDFTLVSGFDLRFTGTLYPGEELQTEMWQERNIVSFRSIATARDEVVIDNGKCTLSV